MKLRTPFNTCILHYSETVTPFCTLKQAKVIFKHITAFQVKHIKAQHRTTQTKRT